MLWCTCSILQFKYKYWWLTILDSAGKNVPLQHLSSSPYFYRKLRFSCRKARFSLEESTLFRQEDRFFLEENTLFLQEISFFLQENWFFLQKYMPFLKKNISVQKSTFFVLPLRQYQVLFIHREFLNSKFVMHSKIFWSSVWYLKCMNIFFWRVKLFLLIWGSGSDKTWQNDGQKEKECL